MENVILPFYKINKFIKIAPENPVLCLPAVSRDGDERCVC